MNSANDALTSLDVCNAMILPVKQVYAVGEIQYSMTFDVFVPAVVYDFSIASFYFISYIS